MKTKKLNFSWLLAVAVLAIAACKKDPVDPAVQVPQQPNPLPANALIKEVRWSASDKYTLTYDAQNKLQQLRSQWEYVEGDPGHIHTYDYDFQYDDQQKLIQVNQTGGLSTRYFYQGNLISKVQELYPTGTVANETVYIYANNRIVEEQVTVTDYSGGVSDHYKRLLKYDTKGNLIKVENFELQADQNYHLLQTNEYSEFDNRLNPTNWLLRYPYVPQVRWQFNNPGKEIVQTVGQAPRTILYVYEYNEQGLPISNTQFGQGGVLTGRFTY